MPTSRAPSASRSYHHGDFTAADLVQRKRQLGDRVSVVIPARDEEPTVGDVAGTLRRTLVDQVPLIDELVVVDADSRDRTAEVARAAGARVVRQSEVLPEAGTSAGKGEALWKGLAATSGELVVFVDADIRDIGPRFVVGLLGPLLSDPSLRFVKAAYDRPFATADGQLDPTGGGRVTELLARPLVASFWPELAWLAQPLAGEYAGRRELLASLPFVRGYGVELALLVDILEQHGPDVIAQVDLGRRVHDHQPLASLSRMSTEILQVAVDRLTRHDRLVLSEPMATTLLQPRRDEAGRLDVDRHEVAPSERPPLSRIPGFGAGPQLPTGGGTSRYGARRQGEGPPGASTTRGGCEP